MIHPHALSEVKFRSAKWTHLFLPNITWIGATSRPAVRKYWFSTSEQKHNIPPVAALRHMTVKMKKSRRGYNFTPKPTPPPLHICDGHRILHVGWTVDIIKGTKFKWICSGVSEPKGPKMTLLHWLSHHLYKSVCIKVIHCAVPPPA